MNLIEVVILILDDDPDFKQAIELSFKLRNFTNYKWCKKSPELFDMLTDQTQVCVIDYQLNEDLSGIEVMEKIKEINSICYCIIMSNQGNLNVVVDAYDKGCDKYINKSDDNFLEILIKSISHGVLQVNRNFTTSIELLARMRESLSIFNKLKEGVFENDTAANIR